MKVKREKMKRKISTTEMITRVGTAVGSVVVALRVLQMYFPHLLRDFLHTYANKLFHLFYPYINITFPEFRGNGLQWSVAFPAIERYLNAKSVKEAKHLKAHVFRNNRGGFLFTMAKHEEVTDHFAGVKLWWASGETTVRGTEKKFFTLTFHRKHRDLICSRYLKHVLDEGKAITLRERRRKLYMNNKGVNGVGGGTWSCIMFEHPSTFDTLAMDPIEKQEIVDDLVNFTRAKDYYTQIGKAWKRGYLLYGPPGTGKSTMIAAMANLLEYDVYDVELTAIEDNTELRKLMIHTSSKSIIVIEDIDCSLKLTGQRASKKDKEKEEKEKREKRKQGSEVTLSGLLNFIDGLWSSCEGERIIVFTTNHVEKLDPALIRRGRMDKHIKMSYCGFESFKVLAKNYLGIHSHDLFGRIKELLEKINMTPADVAENLMTVKLNGDEDNESSLIRLITALEAQGPKEELVV